MIRFSCERVIREIGFNIIFCTLFLINDNNFTIFIYRIAINTLRNRFETYLEEAESIPLDLLLE